jgi:twitching motility protein PilT
MIAAETLGKSGDKRATRALLKGSKDPETGLACIEAIGCIGDVRALEGLVRQLRRPEPEIRAELLDAIEKISDARVVPALEACREQDPLPSLRKRAGQVILVLQGKARPSLRTGLRSAEELHTPEVVDLYPMQRLLVAARKSGASDLHLMAGTPPTLRIHGRLAPMSGPPASADRVKELLRSLLGPREEQALRTMKQTDFCHDIPGLGRYRCNVYVERKGLAGSFRVIPLVIPTLSDIGLPTHLDDLVNYNQGLIVVAGPSGSGKSTTLAALVDLFNDSRRSHILLLEDPIEFVHGPKGCLINQREIGRHTNSFASALRGALREDPDVIVVGEMRDLETIRLAIEASETGHLVIGTMNTSSAAKTVDRIVEAFPVGEQAQVRVMLSETLKVVIAQSLLPNATDDGRVAVFEVMMGTLDVRMSIRDAKSHLIHSQMQIGESKGHITMDRALQRLLTAAKITPEVAWSKARSKTEFEDRVDGDFLASAATGGART